MLQLITEETKKASHDDYGRNINVASLVYIHRKLVQKQFLSVLSNHKHLFLSWTGSSEHLRS